MSEMQSALGRPKPDAEAIDDELREFISRRTGQIKTTRYRAIAPGQSFLEIPSHEFFASVTEN